MSPARPLRAFVAALAVALPGCAALPALGPALQTADAVVKGVCGVIVGASPQDALAAFQAGQRAILEQALARLAPSVDPKVVAALVEGMAANAEGLRALSSRVLELAAPGERPAPARCPAAAPTLPEVAPR